jgi:glycosyltransferase involved in cell wall biosynthesis
MACGAACVTSDHPVLSELAAGHAIAVPARDEDALADALRRLWRSPDHRREVASAGPARAAEFSFELWAAQTFALYRRELARAVAVEPPRREGLETR